MSRQHGLTLVELMVALALGLLVLLGVSTLLVDLTGQQGRDRRAAALRAMGDAAMSTMAMDLRRAGYTGGHDDADLGRVRIGDDGRCVLFAYAPPPGERDSTQQWRGFRLSPGGERPRLQALSTERAHWRCDAADAYWQDLTLPDAGSVQTLRFSRVGQHGVGIRLQLRADALPDASFEATITPRNTPTIETAP